MGSGFRVWTAGEVVSASNVNNYLQEQTVMSFAGTAARSSAIASPEEGMLSYLQDSDTYQGYNGTSWVNLNTLSGTDTSGLVHINTTTFSAVASQSINNVFTSTYKNYRIVLSDLIGSTTSQDVSFRLRKSGTDNTSNIYYFQFIQGNSTTISGGRINTTNFGIGSVISTGTNNCVIDIFSPNVATTKTGMTVFCSVEATSSIRLVQYVSTHDLASSADFDGFTIYPASGTISGSISIFGYKA